MNSPRFLPLSTVLGSALCAAGVSLGTVFCLATTFSLPVYPGRLALLCCAAALVFSAAFSLKKPGPALLALGAALAAWAVLDFSALKNGSLLTVELIMEDYALGFDSLAGAAPAFELPDDTEATAALALIGALPAFFAAWTFTGRFSLWPLAAVTAPFAALCLMIVDILPAPWAFALLLGSFALLALSQGVRRDNGAAGGRLTLALALPVALLATALLLLAGPERHQRADWPDQLQARIQETLEALSLIGGEEEPGTTAGPSRRVAATLGGYDWDAGLEEADLSQAGRRWKTGRRVMEVYSETGGLCYLRGCSLARYADNRWTAAEESYAPAASFWTVDGAAERRVSIRTDKSCAIYYLPCWPTALPAGAVTENDAYVGNPRGETEYTVSCSSPDGRGPDGEDYGFFLRSNYLEVPEETRALLQPIADSLAAEAGGTLATARAIGDYVRGSAEYSLNTGRVPEGEDFVSWFLTESDTGYCVHFASTAALLLRCAGIPSRYVTGYAAELEAGEWTRVTQDQAHAWVEYYVTGYGWLLLDPTPAAGEEPETQVFAPTETAAPLPTPTPVPSGAGTGEPAPPPAAGEGEGAPSAPSAQGGEGERSGLRVPGWLWAAAALLLLPVLWRSGLRRARRAYLSRGSANDRGLACFRHIRRLSALAGEPVPRFAEELAERARFSQHPLTGEELDRLLAYADTLTAALKADRNPLRRLLYRVLWGL